MKKILFGMVLASSLCGCETLWRGAIAVHDSIDEALADGQTPTQPAQAQTLWPYVECNWMAHGFEGENEIRAAAIKEAAASGKAIRFKFRETGTDLRIWTVHWESDMRKGYFGPNNVWSQQAYDAGIRKWVMETECPDDLVIDTFKAYGGPDFQLQVIGATAGVTKGLGLDSNGVKTSPPRMRQ
jgi:hypothetical protein